MKYLVTIMWRDSSVEQFTVTTNESREALHASLEACRFTTIKLKCVAAIYVQTIKPKETN